MARLQQFRRLSAIRRTGNEIVIRGGKWRAFVYKGTLEGRKLFGHESGQLQEDVSHCVNLSHIEREGYKRLQRTFVTMAVVETRNAIRSFRKLANKLGIRVGRKSDQSEQPANDCAWMECHAMRKDGALVRETVRGTSCVWFPVDGAPDSLRYLGNIGAVKETVLAQEGAIQHQGTGQGKEKRPAKRMYKDSPLDPALVASLPKPKEGLTIGQLRKAENLGKCPVTGRKIGHSFLKYGRFLVPLIGWVIVASREGRKDYIVRIIPFQGKETTRVPYTQPDHHTTWSI